MPTHWITIDLPNHGRRKVTACFDGGRMSSDGGALLLRSADSLLDLTGRMADGFRDYRNPARCEHSLRDLIAQRLYGLVLGHEDVNDHDSLRDDSLLALALGRADVTGQSRPRDRDRGHPLAGSSTLNRLELGTPEQAEEDRYKRIVADPQQLDALLVDVFLDQHRGAVPAQIVLDVDATHDPLHGDQEGRHFHGYYDCYCYLPLYVTCGSHVLCGRLRSSSVDPAEGVVAELERIVGQIRERWEAVRVIVRGDAGFCREDLMAWCEGQPGVDYVFGLAQNKRLKRAVGQQQERSRRRGLASGRKSRRYRDFRYRTRDSWSQTRRVVGKAEWLPGEARNNNVRFVVTSLSRRKWGTRELYEELYCARGDMENRIKEQQLDLFADRTSAVTLRANQLRLHWALFAAALLAVIRGWALAGTELAQAQFGTIRTQLLKVAAVVRVSVRRIRVSLSSVYPRQELFAHCLARLRELPTS